MSSLNEKWICKYCERQFQFRQNLSRHLKNVHQEMTNKNQGIKCPAETCEEVFPLRSSLRSHIQEVHNGKLTMEEMKFSSFQEFEAWKQQMEYNSYILKQTPKSLSSGDKKYYYSCFRSGSYSSESTGKRQLKCTGSRKIDGCCPSSIDVIRSQDEVSVKFWKTHFGHSDELGHLFLSSVEKEEIVSKLKQGVTFERILDDVRDNIDGNLQRYHLLTRKDLHNMARVQIVQSSAVQKLNNAVLQLRRKAHLVSSLLDNLEDISEESYSQLDTLLNKEIGILMEVKDSKFKNTEVNEQSSEIIKQQRFYSTKKLKSNKVSISKPSNSEEISIVKGLFESETINVQHKFRPHL